MASLPRKSSRAPTTANTRTSRLSDVPDGFAPLPATPDLSALTMPELRDYRNRIRDEETKVSYWRRLVQARMDIVTSGVQSGPLDIARLVHALGATGSPSTRRMLLRVEHVDSDFPTADGLWTKAVNPNDETDAAQVRADLEAVESRLSIYRGQLHRLLDAATDELIARYRADLSLATDLLPQPPRNRR